MRLLRGLALLICIQALVIAGCGGGGGGGGGSQPTPTLDTTAPTVSLTAPANSATVNGTVAVSADASDNVGVTKVEFYVNNVLKSTDTTAPYSYSWDTTTVVNGPYSLYAKAYDAVGNVGQSATVSVTTNNLITASMSTAITLPTAIGTVTISADPSLIICGLDLKITYPNGVMFVDAIKSGIAPVSSTIFTGNVGATETNVTVAAPIGSGFSAGEVMKVDFSNVAAGNLPASFGVSVSAAFDCNAVQIQ
jgi:hypothetical protein